MAPTDNRPTGGGPRWQKLAAGLLALAVVVAAVIFHSRIGPDFWPLDSSRVGPNLLAAVVQAAVVFILLVVLWPPWRRRFHRFVDAKLAPVHERLTQLHERHDQHHDHIERLGQSLIEVHEKLDQLAKPAARPRARRSPDRKRSEV